MAVQSEDVYCTLLMSDSYLPGAAVLSHSLRDCGTTKKLAVLVTVDSLLYTTLTELKNLFDYVIPVEKTANPNLENLSRLDRLDLRFAFTKINLWRQTQFRRIVYIDADVVALKAPDELFSLDAAFAAAPDIGWPDIFNSGVMVLSPNMGDYRSLSTMASSGTSFDGGDQGLLNQYYGGRPWHRLSFAYNCTPSSSYQYEPAYRHFRSSISMTHFIGKEKPWQAGRESLKRTGSGVYRELLSRWWSVYDRHYKGPTSASSQARGSDRVVQQFVKDDVSESKPSTSTSVSQSKAPPQEQLQATQQPWDATRSAPAPGSKPEAGSFQGRHYAMSHDAHLYHAPTSYPEPPRDTLHYQLPSSQPSTSEKLKPIFPWEHTAKPATRVFAVAPAPSSPPQVPLGTPQTSTRPNRAPSGPSATNISPEAFTQNQPPGFTRTTNAWDSHPSIDSYVRAVKTASANRGKAQVLHNTSRSGSSSVDLGSPTSETPPSSTTKRRESLILTDFPTEVERPSLPVTPAPIHKHTFWGDSRDSSGELPSAEGVPEQSQWDPQASLEQLRRNSLITTEDLPTTTTHNDIPMREVPASSAFVGSPPLHARDVASPTLEDVKAGAERAEASSALSKDAAGVSALNEAAEPVPANPTEAHAQQIAARALFSQSSAFADSAGSERAMPGGFDEDVGPTGRS
ncbi:MAG: glycogenin glucosyltransferase [Chrysothrix sp. TS-e1954]|nr:MAG: glycogenin glucosyltransferase [Chrysothrix sp. TS-e1954]